MKTRQAKKNLKRAHTAAITDSRACCKASREYCLATRQWSHGNAPRKCCEVLVRKYRGLPEGAVRRLLPTRVAFK